MANFKRVTKPIARKMFNSGITIYVLPCKVKETALDCQSWIQPAIFDITSTQLDSLYNKFDRAVNEYEFHNCNAEVGYYAHYYVTEEDMEKYEMCNILC